MSDISLRRVFVLSAVGLSLILALTLGSACGPCPHPLGSHGVCDSGSASIAEQGGGEIALELPIPEGDMLQCVQGAGGSYSHSGTSTAHDIDLDTVNDANEEVYAPTGGTAFVHTESATANFGYHVNIDMGDGTYAVVAHLDEVFVTDGAEVAAGQLLGYEGCTGACTGDHVHIGRHDGDPALKAEYGTSVEVAYYTEDATDESGFDNLSSEDFVCGLTSMGDDVDGHWYRSALPVGRWHPNGTLVKTGDSTAVYRLDDGQRRWISSQDVFSSYGYDFDNVAVIADEELDCYEEGSDISQDGLVDAFFDPDGQLWLVVAPEERSDRYRIQVRDTAWEELLASWGVNYSEEEPPPTVSEDDEYLSDWPEADGEARFRDGTLLKEESRSDVYVVSDSVALPIKDWDTYLLLGFHDRVIITVGDGEVEKVQEEVGNCSSGLWCLDATAVTACGGGLELGAGESGGSESEDDEDDEESDDNDEDDGNDSGADNEGEDTDDADDAEEDDDESSNDSSNSDEDESGEAGDSGDDSSDSDDNDSSSGSGPSDDSGSGSSSDTGVTSGEDTGVPSSSSSASTLTVSWATPFSATADTITLSGEYVFADGSYGFTWRALAAETNEASIDYSVTGVGSGDTLRFSVEYEDAMGNVSWSCIAPYPPGTLQGTAAADVDGTTIDVDAADDPTSDGCGLIVEVP